MAYIKQTWIDHIIADDTGEVLQYGTVINAERMNHIEDGIVGMYTEIDNISGELPEGTTIQKIYEDLANVQNKMGSFDDMNNTLTGHENRITILENKSDMIELDTKVDKVPGMGLSHNDYTNADKAKVDNLPENTTSELDKKVNKVDGMGLSANDFTTPLKNKLNKIPENTKELIDALQAEVTELKKWKEQVLAGTTIVNVDVKEA